MRLSLVTRLALVTPCSYEMLRAIDFLRPGLDVAYCHHEKWDGGS